MKKSILVIIILITVFSLAHAENASPALNVNLTTEKQIYSTNEPIAMALTVSNPSSSPYKIIFSSSYIYDFVLSRDGQPVWKWSAGQMFAQMMTAVELSSANPRTYVAVFNPGTTGTPRLDPGKYKLVGSLQTMNKTYLSDPISIEIRK